MSFLPENYEAPKKTSTMYMKLVDGENRFRILSKPIIGWEDWLDKKPYRYRMDSKPEKSFDPKKPMKHFWAMIVWNCNLEIIQILQITQETIKKPLQALCKDMDWGDPYFYDIKIIKTGTQKDTEYMINPLPHKSTHEYVRQCFDDTPCNLQALFDNADPFDCTRQNRTPGIFDKSELVNVSVHNASEVA